MVTLNILDYSPIYEGSNARQALLHTRELAQLADRLGFHRYWVAEHHQVFSVAGSTPEMLMMQLAASTKKIRIGSGGVMLPHYSPYKVAENFRVLEAFHPNRIDLGIGRSPSFRLVNKALNEARSKRLAYEQQVQDLYKYFTDNTTEAHRFQELIATPVIETTPEIWMLGSGTGGAKVAAATGSAYAFAQFGFPSYAGLEVVKDYRVHFQPSALLRKPKVMVAVFAIIAKTSEKAEEIAKAFDLWLLATESSTGNQPPYYPSIETAKARGLSSHEEEQVRKNRKRAIIGNPEEVKKGIENVSEHYQADEITVIPHFYDAQNRMQGIELLAEAFGLRSN